MFLLILVALGLTAFGFVFIFCLDFVADNTDGDTAYSVVLIIGSLGLVIGFSWEQSFDAAVEDIAERDIVKGVGQRWAKLALASCVCFVVVPAYRHCIWPVVKRLTALDESRWKGTGEA